MPTEKLEPWGNFEIERDDAFVNYHVNPKFLKRMKKDLASKLWKILREMTKIKLTRKLVEENLKT